MCVGEGGGATASLKVATAKLRSQLFRPFFFDRPLFFGSSEPPPSKIKLSQCKIVYKRLLSIKYLKGR